MTSPEGLRVRYGDIDGDYLRRLATTPPEDDGPVWMLNLMHYRPRADYPDGTDHGRSGRDADDRYAPYGPLAAVGAEIVLVADVDTQLLGQPPVWDRVAVVRYPTRRSFVQMQSLPEFQELHVHKDAGMARTIVIGCVPVDPQPVNPHAGAWDEVPHPPTAEDPPVLVLHVMAFSPGGRTGIESYTDHAAVVAGAHGGGARAWFEVDGTILGDGRRWDQVRFNAFPSRAAFMAVARDPDRLAAQAEHREPALEDTYALILRPSIDRLGESLQPATA